MRDDTQRGHRAEQSPLPNLLQRTHGRDPKFPVNT